MIIFVYTVFERGMPQATAIKVGNEDARYLPMYRYGTGLSISDVWDIKAEFRRIIESAEPDDQIVIVGYKDHLNHYKHLKPLCDVYDVPMQPLRDSSEDSMLARLVELQGVELQGWQRLRANAAIVYQGLQERGVLTGFLPAYPIWSMETYSGRSKTLKFNIQGATDDIKITNPVGSADDLFMHFDWSAADIRIAALMSGDELLESLCQTGDPYTAIITDHYKGLERDVCKTALLKSINSLSPDSAALDAFPRLREWVRESKETVELGGSVKTLLGREFKPLSLDRKRILGAFNGSMQGSIAHAMHKTLYEIWQKFPSYLIAEVHDSVVLTAPKRCAMKVMQEVSELMVRPFGGLLDDNPIFPVRISIGTDWKKWKQVRMVRG